MIIKAKLEINEGTNNEFRANTSPNNNLLGTFIFNVGDEKQIDVGADEGIIFYQETNSYYAFTSSSVE